MSTEHKGGSGLGVAPHRHCEVCGRSTPLKKKYCSNKCSMESEKKTKKTKKMSRLFMLAMFVILGVMMVAPLVLGLQ